MKKTFALISALVLTAALFTGCGCRNTRPAETTIPATTPTVATTQPTTETTMPTTQATMPTVDATIEDGNGPMDNTAATEETGVTGRSRRSGIG